MSTSRRSFIKCSTAAAALQSLPGFAVQPGEERRDELWYRKAAERWLGALPIGNGGIVAMIYGGIE
jgi:alpha-L-fucosidase 2